MSEPWMSERLRRRIQDEAKPKDAFEPYSEELDRERPYFEPEQLESLEIITPEGHRVRFEPSPWLLALFRGELPDEDWKP